MAEFGIRGCLRSNWSFLVIDHASSTLADATRRNQNMDSLISDELKKITGKRCVVASIFDNLNNMGSLIQASTMLELFGAQGLYWDKRRLHMGTSMLNVSPKFVDCLSAAQYINENFDLLVVGSDEVWKLGGNDKFSFSYPNPFWGVGVEIEKFAIAVSMGSLQPKNISSSITEALIQSLNSFTVIYVRDWHTERILRDWGISIDGILSDPTFCVDFPVTDKLPNTALNPIEWFASFANLKFHSTDRFHELLACIRGGTPCSLWGIRPKVDETIKQFKLPVGSQQHIESHWPYDEIKIKCEKCRQQWKNTLAVLNSHN